MDCVNSDKIAFHWSRSIIVITAIVFVVLFCAAARLIFIYHDIKGYILSAVVLSPLFMTFLYLPLYLQTDNVYLIIRRIKGKVKIPITEIENISGIQKSDISSSVRIWGSGGLFGYIGVFNNPKIGKFRMYATELSNLYLIRARNKAYVISCKNFESLLKIKSK